MVSRYYSFMSIVGIAKVSLGVPYDCFGTFHGSSSSEIAAEMPTILKDMVVITKLGS